MEVRIFILNTRIHSIEGLRTQTRSAGTLTLMANRTLLTPGVQAGNAARTVSPSWRRSPPALIEPRDDFGAGLEADQYLASAEVPADSRVEFVYAADVGDGNHATIRFDIRGRGKADGDGRDPHPLIDFTAQASTDKLTVRYTVTTQDEAQPSGSATTTVARVVVLVGKGLPDAENAIVRFWNQTGIRLSLMPRTVSNLGNVYGTAAPVELSPELGAAGQGRGAMLLPLRGSTVTYDYLLSGINLKYAVTVSADSDGLVGLKTSRIGDRNGSDVYGELVETTGMFHYNTKVFDVYFIDSRRGVIMPGGGSGTDSADALGEIRKIEDRTVEDEEEQEAGYGAADPAESSAVPYEVTLDIIDTVADGNLVLRKDETVAADGIRFHRHKPVLETIVPRSSLTVPRGPGGMNDLVSGQIGITMPASGVLVLRYELAGGRLVHGRGAVVSLSTGRTSQTGERLFTGTSSDTGSVWVRQRQAYPFATGLARLDALQGAGPNRYRFTICVGSTTRVTNPDAGIVPMGLNFVNRTDMVLTCTRAAVTSGLFPGTGVPDSLDARDRPLSLGKSVHFPCRGSRLELEFGASSANRYSVTIEVGESGDVTARGVSAAPGVYRIALFTTTVSAGKEITIWFAGRNEQPPALPTDHGDDDSGD